MNGTLSFWHFYGNTVGRARTIAEHDSLQIGSTQTHRLLNLFPAPNNPNLFNNFASNPLKINANQFDVRVDHNFSERTKCLEVQLLRHTTTDSRSIYGNYADVVLSRQATKRKFD